MVPINVDFYKLREEILRETVVRIEKTELANYPLDTSWLLYALSFEDKDNNLFFKKGLNDLENWTISDVSGTKDKDLAPLSLCCYLSKKRDVCEKAIEKIKSVIERNITKTPLPKFNVLNDPEQIFCVSLLSNGISDDIKVQLIEEVKKNINGSIIRNIFYSASLFEFGEDSNILDKLESIDNAEDVILSLWLVEHYRSKIKTDLLSFWKLFESIYPSIAINESEGENYLSNRNLALLYEAVVIEIKEANPNMLFDLYPIHPEIKKITNDHFKNKKYSTAIFQAIQKLKELIENKSKINNLLENELVKTTISTKKLDKNKPVQKTPKEIILKFNDYLDKMEGINEQEGLALITEGIFKAFRNPRGHKPEDHPLLEIGPYEALNQLIVIDYIWKRIESAKIE